MNNVFDRYIGSGISLLKCVSRVDVFSKFPSVLSHVHTNSLNPARYLSLKPRTFPLLSRYGHNESGKDTAVGEYRLHNLRRFGFLRDLPANDESQR